jgi:hypothetical protein
MEVTGKMGQRSKVTGQFRPMDITVQQFANEADSALQNDTTLRSIHIVSLIYRSVKHVHILCWCHIYVSGSRNLRTY